MHVTFWRGEYHDVCVKQRLSAPHVIVAPNAGKASLQCCCMHSFPVSNNPSFMKMRHSAISPCQAHTFIWALHRLMYVLIAYGLKL